MSVGRDKRSVPGNYTAQWNDDFHHVTHVLLTGEQQGYYADYTKDPLHRLARALTQGFVYQGERSPFRNGAPRGEPSAHLPPGAFVHFLQNHDQIGNRAFGERLTTLAGKEALRAMLVVLLLSPQPALLFMGEEWGSKQPWFYFCDHAGELAAAVRESRRDEYEKFPQFSDPKAREAIPDPNAASTFGLSRLDWAALDTPDGREWFEFVRSLLRVRREAVVHAGFAGEAGGSRHRIWNGNGLEVTWSAGNSSLILQANLSGQPVADRPDAPGVLLFEWPPGAGRGDVMPAWSAAWYRAPDSPRRAGA